MKNSSVDFFLGANTQQGFVSHFAQMQDPAKGYYTHIIKGGPGSGKSTMIKTIANTFSEKTGICEKIHCSSDPDSLDGIILHQQKVNIVDGTPPHVLEPFHAGALESIVNFYEAFDIEKIRSKTDEIVKITKQNSDYHKRFCELLRCANLLLDGNSALIAPYINHDKLEKAVSNLIKREIKTKGNEQGESQIRMLSAFTPKGLCTYQNTVNALCKRIYLFNDEYNVCTDRFMRLVESAAHKNAYDCYVSYSPFHGEGQLDAVLIPALSLGFVGRNHFVPMNELLPYRVNNATRFYDKDILKYKKQRLRFCRKTAAELLKEGTNALAQAKQVHDRLEDCYKNTVNFEVIGQIQQKLTQTISS